MPHTPTFANGAVYRFGAGRMRMLTRPLADDDRLEAADSWLLTDGLSRALDVHRSRFTASVATQGLDDAHNSGAAWDAAIDVLPRKGAWFPRIEAVWKTDRPEYRLRIRPAPERHTTAVLASSLLPDMRTTPLIKGPDIRALGRLRDTVRLTGADEAVILGPNDEVIDGATSALLWWRDGVLVSPAFDLSRVDSVTARTIQVLAHATGTALDTETITPDDLDGCEVWIVNALHGIRLVTHWVDGPSLVNDPERSILWQRRLAALRRPIR